MPEYRLLLLFTGPGDGPHLGTIMIDRRDAMFLSSGFLHFQIFWPTTVLPALALILSHRFPPFAQVGHGRVRWPAALAVIPTDDCAIPLAATFTWLGFADWTEGG